MEFDDIATENSQAVIDAALPFNYDVERFLRTEEEFYMPVHAAFHPDPTSLHLSWDIDGVILEVTTFAALKAPMPYIYLPTSHHSFPAKAQWPFLKKHLPLREMSAEVMKEWRRVYGVNLGTAEGGWVMILSLVPADKVIPSNILISEAAAKNLTEDVAADVARAVVSQLINLGPMEMTRLSIQKNNIFELAKFRLFRDDQSMFLALIDTAIDSLELPNGVAVLRTVGQLGGQESKPIMLLDILSSMDHIRSCTVHAACSIRHVDPDVDLMWSRWGINKLAGSRGNVFSNLSIHEAANYQSNLDGRPMDVNQKLWSLFKVGNVSPTLNFLQLYCDCPHRPQFPFYKHPISGVIACCGLLHKNSTKAMDKRAREYLQHFRDLSVKGIFHLPARVEGVLLFTQDIPHTLSSFTLMEEKALLDLLSQEAMLLPFKSVEGDGIRNLHFAVVDHIVDRMVEMVKEKGRDVISCLVAGLTAAQLKFFPHVHYRTYKGTKRVNWKNDAYALLRPEGEPETAETRAIKLNELVAQELLERALTEDGHLERYREWGMPWLPMVLSRIPPEVKKEDRKMDLVVYLSCLAIIMNGGFVHFAKLKDLHKSLPVSQKRLLDIRLRSVFSLKTICRDTVLYRLADDIPTTLPATRNPYRGRKGREEEAQEEEPADPGLDESTSQLLVEEDSRQARSISMARPAGKRTKWSPQELALVRDTGDLEADYKSYVKDCFDSDIPHRSKQSFKAMRWRMRDN
ncbi:uncharacterized protein LOC115005926 [Xyrichtys novacula]|nr:uncharacterized protein LOC115005926 [Xyrichtys novacula]CAJ1073239.1 uncharacterized protein LOC115005926 [Xyrichtys novacula]